MFDKRTYRPDPDNPDVWCRHSTKTLCLKARKKRHEAVTSYQDLSVRGFLHSTELGDRFRNLQKRLRAAGLDDAQVGLRGSSVTGVSSKGGAFRWDDSAGGKASDVDFFFVSKQLEDRLDKAGAVFKDGRLPPDRLKIHEPDIADIVDEFGGQTTNLIGRKSNVIILRQQLVDSLPKTDYILY